MTNMPTILIAGATGNTGRSTVETLSAALQNPTNTTLPQPHRILALTRSLSSPAAQHLASLPGVTVIEKSWTEITSSWLVAEKVTRAFIAPHTEPSHFAAESAFHVAALHAGVEYVVRISTTAPNVRPDCEAYYARQHWAVEALLAAPAFSALAWTSLQPNSFDTFWLHPAAAFIKHFRATGKQDTPLRLPASKDAPVGIISADDVGRVAGHLLALKDVAAHNGGKYVLNGPEDITGEEIVGLVEGYIGTKVEEVVWKDMSMVEHMAAQSPAEVRGLILSIRHAPEPVWEGKCTAATTSRAVLDLAPPRGTPAEALRAMVG